MTDLRIIEGERSEVREPPILSVVRASDLADKPVPMRQWEVAGLIPARTVALLAGDGGMGKSILALQLAVAKAARKTWLGRTVTPGRVLYLSAEDDLDELHRRLVDIARGYGLDLDDLSDLHLLPLADEDAVLATAARRGNGIEVTPLWGRLEALVTNLQPGLLILDSLADAFGGDEIIRVQARQFIALLRRLALKFGMTVVVLAHPSLQGINSGTGMSGSTGWHNSVRVRLYFYEPTGAEKDESTDQRILEVKKNNYGPRGLRITVRWKDGMFINEAEPEPGSIASTKASLQAEQTFLDLLARYTVQGREVGPSPSVNYAPKVFAEDDLAKGNSKKAFVTAMGRLLADGKIRIDTYGPPSRQHKRLVLATAADPKADLDRVTPGT